MYKFLQKGILVKLERLSAIYHHLIHVDGSLTSVHSEHPFPPQIFNIIMEEYVRLLLYNKYLHSVHNDISYKEKNWKQPNMWH